jgi:hypothetical protein
MPETLTESFCERCGSRYTFESAAPKQRMRGMRVLSRGVKNFVLDDKTSFDEAMAVARMDTDRESTNAQLDAFHKTFNFCMECRQYTCPNCWNEVEGRCLGCAPMLVDVGPATAPSPFRAPLATPLSAPTNGAAATNGHALVEPEAEFDPLARLAFLTAAAPPTTEPEVVADAAPVVDAPSEVAPVEPALEPGLVADAEAEPVVSASAAPFVAALVEPDLVIAQEPLLEPEPELVAEPASEPVAEPAPEPVEPVAAAAASEVEAAAQVSPAPRVELEPEQFATKIVVTDPADPTTDRAAAAAARTSIMFTAMRPGQSLDEAIAAYDQATVEPEPAAAAAAEPEPVAAAEPEPVAAPEPEPVAAIEPDPEPVVAAEPEPVVAAEPVTVVAAEPAAPEPVAVAPAPAVAPPAPVAVEPPVVEAPGLAAAAIAASAAPADVVAQPTWSVMAPDPDQPSPTSPEWPNQQPAPGLPFLGRPAVPTGGVDALWAASSQQVGAPSPATPGPVGGVQECVSCGLSLSATARFCRRCGSAQHR